MTEALRYQSKVHKIQQQKKIIKDLWPWTKLPIHLKSHFYSMQTNTEKLLQQNLHLYKFLCFACRYYPTINYLLILSFAFVCDVWFHHHIYPHTYRDIYRNDVEKKEMEEENI